jgi:hypothetical protein
MVKTHKDIGLVNPILEWEGDGKKIALVVSSNRGYRDWYGTVILYEKHHLSKSKYYYCLWGNSNKPIEELAVVACETNKLKPQTKTASLKRFYKMVEAAEQVTFK